MIEVPLVLFQIIKAIVMFLSSYLSKTRRGTVELSGIDVISSWYMFTEDYPLSFSKYLFSLIETPKCLEYQGLNTRKANDCQLKQERSREIILMSFQV